MFTERLSEKLAIVGTVDPDAYCAGTFATDEIPFEEFNRLLFIVMAGALSSCGSVDFKLQGGPAGSVTNDISGKDITALTAAGCDDDKQVKVEITAEEFEQAMQTAGVTTWTHVRGLLTVASAACDAAVIALGSVARYGPASDNDLASVDETLA